MKEGRRSLGEGYKRPAGKVETDRIPTGRRKTSAEGETAHGATNGKQLIGHIQQITECIQRTRGTI